MTTFFIILGITIGILIFQYIIILCNLMEDKYKSKEQVKHWLIPFSPVKTFFDMIINKYKGLSE
jgi:hypothetical protein